MVPSKYDVTADYLYSDLQTVPLPYTVFLAGGMVPWRDLFFFQAEDGIRALYVTGVQTCALPIFDVFVGDHHELTVYERVRQAGTDQVPVALVVGMHRDRGVAEHRFHAGGGHHDVWLRVVHRAVPERHEFALDLFVGDLDVG